ncbi:MAG: hypothetical protein AABX23_00365 [Nanoarchaeota archaeon]|mgnify:CR=1 FL=1
MKNQFKKVILFYPPNEKKHSLYGETIAFLSKHHHLLYTPSKSYSSYSLMRLSRNYFLRKIYLNFIRPHISFIELKNIFFPNKNIQKSKNLKFDLIYSTNYIPSIPGSYILDLENVSALGGYDYYRLNKSKIGQSFESDDCKAIICWNEASKESLLATIKSEKFIKKIHVLPFAIKKERIKKKLQIGKIRLLFVSSINNPQDFEMKGGIIALEVYKELVDRFNNIEFVIRSKLSNRIKKKYSNLKNLVLIEEYLSDKEFSKLLSETDILLEPIPGIQLMIECLKFRIPAVVFDFWAAPEIIFDGKNGFIIDSRSIFGDKKNMKKYIQNMGHNFLKLYSPVKKSVFNEYINKTSILISNKMLRDKMMRYANNLLNKGRPYNSQQRNKLLLNIINRATKSSVKI